MAEPVRKQERAAERPLDADRPLNAEESEDLLDEADDAVISMEARERRRDSAYKTGGDDQDPGIDSEIDSNAPKELQKPPRKRGST